MEKPKSLDAVRLVRRIRDAHYEELRGATREERIAFYNGGVRPPQERRAEPSAGRARESAV